MKSYAGVPCTTTTEGLPLSGPVKEETPVKTPTFAPSGGEVAYGSTVTITCETDGATLYYTTDGSLKAVTTAAGDKRTYAENAGQKRLPASQKGLQAIALPRMIKRRKRLFAI